MLWSIRVLIVPVMLANVVSIRTSRNARQTGRFLLCKYYYYSYSDRLTLQEAKVVYVCSIPIMSTIYSIRIFLTVFILSFFIHIDIVLIELLEFEISSFSSHKYVCIYILSDMISTVSVCVRCGILKQRDGSKNRSRIVLW